jgi:hypothetical protein
VLTEMRGMLETVQVVVDGVKAGDMMINVAADRNGADACGVAGALCLFRAATLRIR